MDPNLLIQYLQGLQQTPPRAAAPAVTPPQVDQRGRLQKEQEARILSVLAAGEGGQGGGIQSLAPPEGPDVRLPLGQRFPDPSSVPPAGAAQFLGEPTPEFALDDVRLPLDQRGITSPSPLVTDGTFQGFQGIEHGFNNARLPIGQRQPSVELSGDTGEVRPFDVSSAGDGFFGLAPTATIPAGRPDELTFGGPNVSAVAETEQRATEADTVPEELRRAFNQDGGFNPALGQVLAEKPEAIIPALVQAGIRPPKSIGASKKKKLSGIKAPTAPKQQRVSTPSAPRPSAISGQSAIANLVSKLTSGGSPDQSLRLKQAVEQR